MLKEIIKRIFGDFEEINKKENFSFFEIKYRCKDLKVFSNSLNKKNYTSLKEYLQPLKYKWDIYIEEYEYSVSQETYKKLNIEFEDTEEYPIDIIFKIHKSGNKLFIFDEKLFNNFLNSLDFEAILTFFKNKGFPITFINNTFTLEIGKESEVETSNLISKQCNFRNYSQFNFSPEYFYINKNANENYPELTGIINKIALIYCLIYIFDSSEINKNDIELVISGTKTNKLKINFNTINQKLLTQYYKIFSWTYSDKTKIEDKIGISRNIITSYLKDNSIEINDSVFTSILSSNQIYIKNNISKYFEVKGKIIDQIENTIKKVNESINTFFNTFQKSIFIFISFFLSVFLYKMLRQEDLSKVFNKETSLIGLIFIALSFVFLLFSRFMLFLDKKRIKERYVNIKKRYKDVLIEEDIKNILNEDEEFNNEVNFLDKRIKFYTYLWVFTLLVFVIILFITSDYLDFLKRR